MKLDLDLIAVSDKKSIKVAIDPSAQNSVDGLETIFDTIDDLATVTAEEPDFVVVPFSDLELKPCKATETLQAAIQSLPRLSVRRGPFIAGGILVRSLLGEDHVNDVDLFCLGTPQLVDVAKKLNVYELEMSTMLGDQYETIYVDVGKVSVQLCRVQNATTVSGLLAGFDFYHCMIATDGREVLMHKDAIRLLQTRSLRLNTTSRNQKLDSKNFTRILKARGLNFKPEEGLTWRDVVIDEKDLASLEDIIEVEKLFDTAS